MSVDRPRTGAATTCFDSRVAAAAIGSLAPRAPRFDSRTAATAVGSPLARFDPRAAAAAMPAGPAIGRTLIGYQPAGAIPGAPSATFRAAAEAAALAHAAEDSARTTEWVPLEIELTLDVLDPLGELDPFDPSATIELTPVELAALAAAAAAHEAALAAPASAAPATPARESALAAPTAAAPATPPRESTLAGPASAAPATLRESTLAGSVAVATRSRRLATSPRSTVAAAHVAAAAPTLPPSARPPYRCPPRPPRPGLFIGCLAASALLILLYALYVFWALAQASAHGT